MPDLNFADLRRDAESGVDVPEFDTLTQRARARRRRRRSGISAIAAAAVAVLAVVGGGMIDLNRADVDPADAPTEPPVAEQRAAQQDVTSSLSWTEPSRARFPSPGIGLVVFHTPQGRSYAATANGWDSIHYGILQKARFVTSLSDDTFFVRTPRGGLVIDPATGERRDIRGRPLEGVHSEHSLLAVAPHVGPKVSGDPLPILLVDKRHGTVAPMPLPGPVVSSSVVSHGDGERIWIVTKKDREQTPMSLFYSDDHGVNWHEARLPEGLQARRGQVTLAARDDGMLAVKAFPQDRVYLSADSGRDWVAMDAPDASRDEGWIRALADGRLYYVSWDLRRLRFVGGYVSTDESWRGFTPLDIDGSPTIATQSGALVRGKDRNLRVSWDGGSTWSTVDIPRGDS